MGVTSPGRARANIAVTGAGPSGMVARAFLRAELDGVRLLALGDDTGLAAAQLEHMLREIDMLVFVVDAAEALDANRTVTLARAARSHGVLIAALVVSRSERFENVGLLAALREAADMVMIVRDPDDVRGVVAALR